MLDTIVSYLNTDYPSITWVRYGDGELPSQPYGVIKGEKLVNGRGIRVIIHRNIGCVNELEDDLHAVIDMLSDKSFVSRHGNNNRLSRLIDYTDVTAVSDDGTLSMEALFLMPTQTF